MADNGTIVPLSEQSTMDEQPSSLAADVRERRRALSLTQDDLAALAGCSPRFVRALEAGKPTIRLDKLLDVLGVLGLELRAQIRSTR